MSLFDNDDPYGLKQQKERQDLNWTAAQVETARTPMDRKWAEMAYYNKLQQFNLNNNTNEMPRLFRPLILPPPWSF